MSTRYNHGSHFENHQRAAELHESAAHAHRSAAEADEKQDHISAARNAMVAKVSGIVMEGDFPEGTATLVKRAAAGAPVVELTARSKLQLGSMDPIIWNVPGGLARSRAAGEQSRPDRLGVDQHEFRLYPSSPRMGHRRAVGRERAAAQDPDHGHALSAGHRGRCHVRCALGCRAGQRFRCAASCSGRTGNESMESHEPTPPLLRTTP